MSYVINIFGGPCSGKSTTAAGLFHMMKVAGYSVEYVPEWIKSAMYEERDYPILDQLYTLAHQAKLIRENYGKVDYVITDSPILVSAVYNEFYRNEISDNRFIVDDDTSKLFEVFTISLFHQFNNINIFLDRIPYNYEETGRKQEYDEALMIDNMILSLLHTYKVDYKSFPISDNMLVQIIEYITVRSQTSSPILNQSSIIQ